MRYSWPYASNPTLYAYDYVFGTGTPPAGETVDAYFPRIVSSASAWHDGSGKFYDSAHVKNGSLSLWKTGFPEWRWIPGMSVVNDPRAVGLVLKVSPVGGTGKFTATLFSDGGSTTGGFSGYRNFLVIAPTQVEYAVKISRRISNEAGSTMEDEVTHTFVIPIPVGSHGHQPPMNATEFQSAQEQVFAAIPSGYGSAFYAYALVS